MKFKLSTVALAMLPAMVLTSAIAEEVQPAQYSANSLIVTYKAGTTQAQKSLANNGASAQHFNNILGGRLAKLTVATDDIHVLMKRLRKHPAIESVELDYHIAVSEPAAVVNDPAYDNLWGMKNTGQTITVGNRSTVGTAGADVDAETAWQKTTGSKEVVVGVIDTGVDYTHEDLVNNMWTNTLELYGEDGVDDDGNGYVDDVHGWDAFDNEGDPMDTHGHGTHVSGTIGAEANNGMGVVGMNHDVTIVGCRFLGPNGGSTSGAIACLDYMLAVKEKNNLNLKVTNNSWGGGDYSEALENAISAHNDAGVLFAAAAGNNASDNDMSDYYPSNYDVPNVMSIASTTNKDQKSGFSQWGLTTVDMGAPGSDILSTYPAASVGGESRYAWLSGTSMATPMVSGAAALLAAIDGDITVAEMKDILMNTGDPIDALAGRTVSGKRLNVANAVDEANPVKGYKLSTDENYVTITAGETAEFSINSAAKLDWDGTISFSASGDLETNFTPESITSGDSTSLSVATTADTPFGLYNIMVDGETDGQNDNEGNPIKDKSISFIVDVLPNDMETFTFARNETIDLPDGDKNGVQSVLSLTDVITTITTKVSINIPTGNSNDLRIKLTSPAGTTKVVHNRTSVDGEGLVAEIDLGRAFYGETVAGDWTLTVADEVRLDRATFTGWSVSFDGVGSLADAAPATEFSYVADGLTVAFTDLSTDNNNDIVSYAWDFGDGATSTTQNLVHTFASDGSYEVSLTVTDSLQQSTTRTKTVWAAAASLELTVPRQYLSRRGTLRNKLVWTGSVEGAETVSIIRNGEVIASDVSNTGKYTDSERKATETSFEYQVCDSDGVCSPVVLVEF